MKTQDCNPFRLYKTEIEALAALADLGYCITLSDGDEDEYGEREYGEDGPVGWSHNITSGHLYFHTRTREGVYQLFGTGEEIVIVNGFRRPEITASLGGTHCGRLTFTLGWVHETTTTQQELQNACVQHMYDGKMIATHAPHDHLINPFESIKDDIEEIPLDIV